MYVWVPEKHYELAITYFQHLVGTVRIFLLSTYSIHGSAVATSTSIPRPAAAAEGRDRPKAAIDGGRRPASGRVEPAEHEVVGLRRFS